MKVEFENAAGFRSDYLSDLSEGGVQINTSMEVGQHFVLNISFLGFVDPLQIEAVVQWSLPATHPNGPAAGLAFLDPSPEDGQEVRNWAELRDEKPLELVELDDAAAWLDEITRAPAMLGIIDVDELPTTGLDLYRRVRDDAISVELPLIVLGSPANIAPFSAVSDELLFCLRKPLRFGLLMNTVRVLAHDPLPASPSDKLRD